MNPDRIRTVEIRVNLEHLANPTLAGTEVANAVYEALRLIFETGGECNRRTDGTPALRCNGHHVAQKLTDAVEAEWLRIAARGGC